MYQSGYRVEFRKARDRSKVSIEYPVIEVTTTTTKNTIMTTTNTKMYEAKL